MDKGEGIQHSHSEDEVQFILDGDGDDSLRRQDDFVPFYEGMMGEEEDDFNSDDGGIDIKI